MTDAGPVPGDEPPVLVVLSDLHLGAGRYPETRLWSRLEDFFYDRELASFLDHLWRSHIQEGPGARLILNGDCFDFLTVADVPTPEEAKRHGLRVRRAHDKFGLPHTARASVWKLEQILRGHPRSFSALALFLLRGGEIVVLPGNHDPELFFPEVQARIEEHLITRARELEPDRDLDPLRRQLRFEPWFWYEPGRVLVEHGHQYDETNVVPHLLCPLSADQGDGAEVEIDLPLGSYFVRFLHNGLKRQNPYMRNFVSLAHYLEFLGSQNILRSLRQSYRNGTFLLRAMAETPLRAGERAQPRKIHRQRRDELAARCGLGDALAGIEALWPAQMARTKARLTRKLIEPAARQAGIALLVAAATIYVWSLFFNLILSVPWLAKGPFSKAGWLALFAVLTFAAVALSLRTFGRMLHTTTDVSFGSLARHADLVARKVKVPNICMGHTHLAERVGLPSGAEYANSGTWTAMDGPWNKVHPRAMQFTFIRLDGAGLHLRRWDHASREETTVDLYEPAPSTFLWNLESAAEQLTSDE